MTSVSPGSDSSFFYDQSSIVDHLLSSVLANTKREIGTEWEMFFVRPEFFTDPKFFTEPDLKSFSRADGQKTFIEFERVFKLQGYQPEYIWEQEAETRKIIGIKVPTLGMIVPEAGHQFEFSCSVCQRLEEVEEKNEEAFRVIAEVAKRLNLVVVFRGHIPGFAEKTEGMDRSRSLEWRRYYESHRFDDRARYTLHETQDGTASVQVTIDAGAENFHEFFQALLLLEPALTFHYANSNRSFVGMRAYGEIIPSQVEPIVTVWGTQSPRAALEAIVDRLMDIDVPFLPDATKPGLYKAETLLDDRPPTVKEIMRQGRLSEKALNNIGGFFYTRPAFKNFYQALLEVRGVDSQPRPEMIVEVARRVSALLYNDDARKKLLKDYSYLSQADIKKLHQVAITAGKGEAAHISIGGITMAAFVADILARSQPEADDETLDLPMKQVRNSVA